MFLEHPNEEDLAPLTWEEFDKKMEELLQCKADLHEFDHKLKERNEKRNENDA